MRHFLHFRLNSDQFSERMIAHLVSRSQLNFRVLISQSRSEDCAYIGESIDFEIANAEKLNTSE